MKRILAVIITACLVALALCSCARSSGESISNGSYYDSNDSYNKTLSESSEKTNSDGNTSANSSDLTSEIEQKLIKNYTISLETLEYDKAKTSITALVAANSGYFSSSTESNGSIAYNGQKSRTGTYVIRVPSENLETFVEALKKEGNVLSSNLTTQDVTESYYNYQSRLDALVLQEERILSMMEKTDSLEYLIQLEDKLSEIRSEINNINYQLKYYDKSVDYSYVYLSISEVIEYQEVEEPTFFSRLGKALSGTFVTFANVLGEIFIVFIWVFPFLLFGGAIAVIITLAEKKNRKKKQLAKAQNQTENHDTAK